MAGYSLKNCSAISVLITLSVDCTYTRVYNVECINKCHNENEIILFSIYAYVVAFAELWTKLNRPVCHYSVGLMALQEKCT